MSTTGFLIITRALFVDSLTQYIAWKQSRGFSVQVVTAEQVEATFQGADIRFKIRNCIRHYYKTEAVSYVLLIGDSPDLPYPEETQGPPLPSLTDPWSLPAGYYRFDALVNNQPITRSVFSTLFYADLADTHHFTEYKYGGDYQIYVGLMPVRTPQQLQVILNKTMACQVADSLRFIYSEDFYDPIYANKTFQQIQLLTGGSVAMSQALFGTTAADSDAYAAVCNSKGIVVASGHGFMEPGNPNQTPGFRVGNTWLCSADGQQFSYLNSLYIAAACWGDAYQYGECVSEAWLQAANGPVTMVSKPPITYPVPSCGGLTSSEQGFWSDLVASKSIGQAFYDNCAGAYADPLNLFGDPSIVVVKPSSTGPTTLAVAQVGAPAINCVFDPSCRVVVADTTAKIVLKGASGSGFLQSRTFTGQPGSPGAGLYVYEYRIDLRHVYDIGKLPAITSLSIDFGAVLNTLDYNGDGKLGEQVFVISSGGLGSVAPVAVVKNGGTVTFDFGAGIRGGTSPGKGQSSYFFGLVSTRPPKYTAAQVVLSAGLAFKLQTRSPAY